MKLMYGVDSDQLDQLAVSLDSSANELQALMLESAGEVALATLGATMMTIWRGPRAHDFANLWRARHLAKLNGLEEMLRDAARDARANANEQRLASESIGSAASGSRLPFVASPASGSVDQRTVDGAVDKVSGLLEGSVSHHDLDKIKDQLRELSEAERVLLISRLSDDELELLLTKINAKYKFPASKAEFWGLVVPFLSIGEKRRIFGDQWAKVTEAGTADAADPPNHLLADIMHDIQFGSNNNPIAQDEIEIRVLANGKYIVVLPGVTDLSGSLAEGGLAGAAAAVKGGPVVAGAAALLTTNQGLNDPSAIGSARDTKYAKDSLRNGQNTSQNGANAYAFAVKEAMQEAGIPVGADVMIVGHSFGSMTATDLAGDETFNSGAGADSGYYVNIDRVVAAGAYSPMSVSRVPDSVELLSFRSDNDRVVSMEAADLVRHDVLHHTDRTDSRTISFKGGSDGYKSGHAESNYERFLDESLGDHPPDYKGTLPADSNVGTFSDAAAADYGGEAKLLRVKVKDAYSDPRLEG